MKTLNRKNENKTQSENSGLVPNNASEYLEQNSAEPKQSGGKFLFLWFVIPLIAFIILGILKSIFMKD